MEDNPYGLGADISPRDIRTFAYVPTTGHISGGERYKPEDIENQHKVGICTAISLTQNAAKALGMKFSADFQYLQQKKFVDKNWDEGSSIFSALKIGKGKKDEAGNFLYGGLLPVEHFNKWVTEEDRKLPYEFYIRKLQAVPEAEIRRLIGISKHYCLAGYARVTVNRDTLANAIDESAAGILARFDLGKEWWTKPIEPLRVPTVYISGHAVTKCNYHGNSFRNANTWGRLWNGDGTAYYLINQYQPTEAWIPYYTNPPHVDEALKARETLIGKLQDKLQQLLELLKLAK